MILKGQIRQNYLLSVEELNEEYTIHVISLTNKNPYGVNTLNV